MPRLLSVLLAIALLSAGCTTRSRLHTPDGSSRIPINRSEAIAEYSRGMERDQAAERDQAESTRQLERLKREIEDLRTSMAAPDRRQEEALAAASIRPASAVPYVVVQQQGTPSPAEIIRADDQAIMFRSFFANGDTQFKPSPYFQQALVKAAIDGHSIAICGATDARLRTPASEAIARLRAESARKFLVDKGVDPAKVKTKFLAAGGFIADNSAPAGRMKNRRVDIEVIKSVHEQRAGQ